MPQQQNNVSEHEIDLAKISNQIKRTFNDFEFFLYDCLLFLKRYTIVITLLLLAGIGLGVYLDSQKAYEHRIIVLPNFSSTEYLYSKIDEIQSKISESDTLFLKSIGFDNPAKISSVEIEPLNDVYEFVNKSPTNFELIKLMAEDGDINKIIEDETTSKNYGRHIILINSSSKLNYDKSIIPLLKFLNESNYYSTVKDENLKNVLVKLQLNDSIIFQINKVVNEYSDSRRNSASKGSSSFIYYNENTPVSELLKIKDELIKEQANLRLGKINYEKTVRDLSTSLNIIKKKGLIRKKTYIIPVVFVGLFVFAMIFSNYLKRLKNRKDRE